MRVIHIIIRWLADLCASWADEMRAVVRDEGMLIFLCLVPLAYPLLYSWIYNNEVVREVPVVVVDASHTAASRRFIARVDASPSVSVADYAGSMDEAQTRVRETGAYGIIALPADFGLRLGRGEQAHVSVYTDMSLMLTYKAIYQTAQAVAMETGAECQAARGMAVTRRDAEVMTSPIEVDEVAIYNCTGGYGNALLPGVLILIIQQTLLLGIGLAAGTRRERIMAGMAVPVSRGVTRDILGHALCYLSVYAVMAAWIVLAVPRIFGFVTLAPASVLIALVLPYLLACIFMGLMLSSLVRYRENVLLLVVFTSVPLLFMSGATWPVGNIPGVWQGVAMLFPSTWGIRGFLSASSMGAEFDDIRTACMALWIQAVAYLAVTIMITKIRVSSYGKSGEREK